MLLPLRLCSVQGAASVLDAAKGTLVSRLEQNVRFSKSDRLCTFQSCPNTVSASAGGITTRWHFPRYEIALAALSCAGPWRQTLELWRRLCAISPYTISCSIFRFFAWHRHSARNHVLEHRGQSCIKTPRGSARRDHHPACSSCSTVLWHHRNR
jgi:hypothetical protein